MKTSNAIKWLLFNKKIVWYARLHWMTIIVSSGALGEFMGRFYLCIYFFRNYRHFFINIIPVPKKNRSIKTHRRSRIAVSIFNCITDTEILSIKHSGLLCFITVLSYWLGRSQISFNTIVNASSKHWIHTKKHFLFISNYVKIHKIKNGYFFIQNILKRARF